MTITRAICIAITAAVLTSGSAVIAKKRAAPAARCWTPTQITAAKVNELSILLNVQSLRCRNEDKTIQDQYDAFTRASAGTMRGVAATVKGHFGGSASLYDRYAISLANKYGAGVVGQSCPMVANLMQSAIAGGKSLSGLSQVGETANIDPTLLGGPCGLHPGKPFIASKTKLRPRHKK
jgi:hypothetical protein